MANWRHRRLLRQAWHPADEELLLYVEGEADARGARRVSDHLSGCWTCRARRDEIERAIGAYMAYDRDRARAAVIGGDDPEQATRRFAAALARAQQQRHAPASELVSQFASPSSRPGRSWRMPGLRRVAWTLAQATALLVVIVFAARWWLAPAPVSARELLARVDRAQQQEIAAVADPVIYQRLHASRTSTSAASTSRASADDTVTWEVWSSQRQRRIVERVSASAPLLLDLQTVLRENGMEPGQPLSAASLTAWRRFAGHVAEDVRETTLSDGTAAVTLTSSAPGTVGVGRIARSEVIVRTRDWHPVTHILTVAGAAGQQQRYTITELNYRIVPFETVDATVFNPPAIVPSVDAGEATTEDAPAAPAAPPIHPARAALLALYEEHTTGACLQDRAFTESDTAMRHLWAIRQLAEWYRTAQHDGLERGLDGKSRAMLAAMLHEHLEAARGYLPSSSEVSSGAAAIEPDVATGSEPWTTVAMKAYAAVEYVSRADTNDGGTRQEAVARARALLRSLDAAVQRLAPGAASGGARPAAADPPRGVTPPRERP